MPITIGLRGVPGSGKTSTALLLAAKHHMSVVSMANPIRAGLERMGICKKEKPELYCRLAVECGDGARAADPDHWLPFAHAEIKKAHDRGLSVVIDDIRYPNEAELCDYLFFLVPVDFKPVDVGDRHLASSEQWNLQYVRCWLDGNRAATADLKAWAQDHRTIDMANIRDDQSQTVERIFQRSVLATKVMTGGGTPNWSPQDMHTFLSGHPKE